MSWRGQVRAVFVKDLRQEWWMLALLAGVMVLTVARVTVSQPGTSASFGWYDTFIPLLILWIVAAVVRADPPAVSTAFWATQPLETSAVATAKLLQAVVVTVVVIGGATAVLRWWGIAWGDVPATVTITTIGAITIAISAALLATLGTEARGMLLGVVATIFALLAFGQLAPQWLRWPMGKWGQAVWVLLIAADIVAMLQLYRAREAALPWRLGGSALVAGTVICALTGMSAQSFPLTAGVSAPPFTLAVIAAPSSSNAFGVTLDGLLTRADYVQILDATLRIDLPDGSSLVLPVVGAETRSTRVSSTSPQTDTHSEAEAPRWTLRAFTTPQTQREWSRLHVAGAKVTFDGTVAEFMRQELRRAPLISGVLTSTHSNARQELRMVARDSTKIALFTSRWFLHRSLETVPPVERLDHDLRFRLVERATGKVVAELDQDTDTRSHFYALPGIGIVDMRAELGTNIRAYSGVSDTTWWATHDILITAPAPKRAYRVHAETVVDR